MLYLLALMIPIHPPMKSSQNARPAIIISAMTMNTQLILNSNTFEILTQYIPNTIFNTSDTSDTSSIQTQYIQILPIHPDFAGLVYRMYLFRCI